MVARRSAGSEARYWATVRGLSGMVERESVRPELVGV
jgi:hypothetical protein